MGFHSASIAWRGVPLAPRRIWG